MIALALTLLPARAEAAKRRWVCETWRDYYYLHDTGEFVGWAGPEYRVCYDDVLPGGSDDDPDLPDDIDGGVGSQINLDSAFSMMCDQCEQQRAEAVEAIPNDLHDCQTWAEDLSRRTCDELGIRRTLPDGTETICWPQQDWTWKPGGAHCAEHPAFKPNPAYTRCVDHYMNGGSDTTSGGRTTSLGAGVEKGPASAGIDVKWGEGWRHTSGSATAGFGGACEQVHYDVQREAAAAEQACKTRARNWAKAHGKEHPFC